MAKINRYCVLNEEHEGDNAFRVHRGYILGNPYTHIKDKKTKAMIVVNTKEEAIRRYKKYFELSLELNPEFKEEFDRLVDACMTYDEVWVGCYCPLNEECHSDYIIQRAKRECRKRMLDKIKEKKKSS